MRRACGAELLEDDGEKENVGEQVEVAVLGEQRHAERGPRLLGVGVVGVGDIGLAEPAVEGRLWRESRPSRRNHTGKLPFVREARCGWCRPRGG